MSPAIDPLGTLLQNVGEGVCLVDAEGRFVVGNRRHAELLELPDDFLRTGDPIDKLLEFLRDRGDNGSDEAYREIRRRISEATQKALVYERPGTGVRPWGRTGSGRWF